MKKHIILSIVCLNFLIYAPLKALAFDNIYEQNRQAAMELAVQKAEQILAAQEAAELTSAEKPIPISLEEKLPEPGEPRFKLSLRPWFVDEACKWTATNSSANSQTRLTYPNKGVIYLAGITYRIFNRLFVDFNYASGKTDGTGTGTDWLLGDSREFEHSTFDSNGEISFYETNLYLRLYQADRPLVDILPASLYSFFLNNIFDQLNFDLFSGYQFYRADYLMSNQHRDINTFVPVNEFIPDFQATYRTRHNGMRFGAQINLQSTYGISLNIRSAYLPWVEAKGIGWWNLDLYNFTLTGGRGQGYDGEIYVSYTPKKVPGLSVGAGYRYLRLVNRGGLLHNDGEQGWLWDLNWDATKSSLKGAFCELSYKF